MKKKDLKQLVVAGMVAGSLLATGAVHAVEGEIVAAGSHGCAGGCGGKNRPTTADNYAPQQQNMQRPATQEEIRQQEMNRQQQLRNQQQHAQQQNAQQQNQNYQGQPAQSCKGQSGCKGR